MGDLCYKRLESGFSINSLITTKKLKYPTLRLLSHMQENQEENLQMSHVHTCWRHQVLSWPGSDGAEAAPPPPPPAATAVYSHSCS